MACGGRVGDCCARPRGKPLSRFGLPLAIGCRRAAVPGVGSGAETSGGSRLPRVGRSGDEHQTRACRPSCSTNFLIEGPGGAGRRLARRSQQQPRAGRRGSASGRQRRDEERRSSSSAEIAMAPAPSASSREVRSGLANAERGKVRHIGAREPLVLTRSARWSEPRHVEQQRRAHFLRAGRASIQLGEQRQVELIEIDVVFRTAASPAIRPAADERRATR